MAYCTACGSKNDPASKFCEFCGSPQATEPITYAPAGIPAEVEVLESPDAEDPGFRRGFAALPKRVRKTAALHIGEDDSIEFSLVGTSSQTLVVLQDRVLVLKPGWMANSSFGCRATTISLADITGIQVNTGMVTAVVEISSPSYQAQPADYWQSLTRVRDARAQSPHVLPNCIPAAKRQVRDWAPQLERLRQMVRDAKSSRHSPTVTAPSSQPHHSEPPDLIEQIKKLGELRDAGLLTDAEFESKKSDLLSRL